MHPQRFSQAVKLTNVSFFYSLVLATTCSYIVHSVANPSTWYSTSTKVKQLSQNCSAHRWRALKTDLTTTTTNELTNLCLCVYFVDRLPLNHLFYFFLQHKSWSFFCSTPFSLTSNRARAPHWLKGSSPGCVQVTTELKPNCRRRRPQLDGQVQIWAASNLNRDCRSDDGGG